MICQQCHKRAEQPLELYDGGWACPHCKHEMMSAFSAFSVTAENEELFTLSERSYYRWLTNARRGQEGRTWLDKAVELCRESARLGNPLAVTRLGYYYDKDYVEENRSEAVRCRIAYAYYSAVCFSDAELKVQEGVLGRYEWKQIRVRAAEMMLNMLAFAPEELTALDKFNFAYNRSRVRAKLGIDTAAERVEPMRVGRDRQAFETLYSCFAKQRAPLFEKIRMGRRREQNREQARRSGREQRQSRLPGRVSLKGNPQKERSGWTIPDLCRAGSLFLLLILVLLGLTSINRYPDMKEIAGLFANAAKSLWGDGGEQAVLAERDGQSALVVEEGSLQEEALVEEAVPDEGTGEEEELLVAEDGQVVWRIGGEEASSAETPSVSAADAKETVSGETIQEDPPQGQGGSEEVKVREGNSQQQESEPSSDEEASFLETEEGQEGAREETAQQAISRPVTYVVKKGDSLAQIARKFYGNTSRLQEICTLNEIEDPDQIRPGQNILLP